MRLASVSATDGITIRDLVTTRVFFSVCGVERGEMRLENNRGSSSRHLRYLHEILFSLNIAFAVTSFVELVRHNLMSPFFQLEFSIQKALSIHQTDLLHGYFALSISSIVLALCLWALLRLSSRTNVTAEILRSFAGILVLLGPPAFWLYINEVHGWPYGFPYRGAPFELIVAVACSLLFLSGKWSISEWWGVLLAASHYAFWFWLSGSIFTANYTGPITPLLGFSSIVVWGLYVGSFRVGQVSR
jgi:hypothetical protein